jgi:predicted nucleic acid-binding protein
VTLIADAGAIVALVTRTASAASVADHFATHRFDVRAPHLLDAEVPDVLRKGSTRASDERDRAATEAFDRFRNLGIPRYPHKLLLPRVWDLRWNFTAYDALYVALAEVLDADLITTDRALGRAAETHTAVNVIIPEPTS